MAKDPAMLLYTADFLVGVAFMPMEARGQYITLLCLQHQKGHMDISCMEMAVGKIYPSVLCHFVQDEDGLYYNERADKESIKRQAYSESRRKNRARPNISNTYDSHMKNICSSYENHMENENENVNDNKDKNENVNKVVRHKYGQYNNVLLSDDDMGKLQAEFTDWQERIERLSEYIASTGKSYKSHLATIRSWARKESSNKREEHSGNVFMDMLRERGGTQ